MGSQPAHPAVRLENCAGGSAPLGAEPRIPPSMRPSTVAGSPSAGSSVHHPTIVTTDLACEACSVCTSSYYRDYGTDLGMR